LNLLAEIDTLFGDYPGAVAKWQRLLAQISDPDIESRLQARMARFAALPMPEKNLVDDLEAVNQAVQLYLDDDFLRSLEILERLEEEGFADELPSADFFCMLGLCRLKTDDQAGAFASLSRALDIDPDHVNAQEALAAFHSQEGLNA
jgi:tetratricopeptide (TPR) repeat protein